MYERDSYSLFSETTAKGIVCSLYSELTKLCDYPPPSPDPTLMLNITSSKSSLSVLLGDYITLTCSASSDLPPDTVYTWTLSNTNFSSRVLEETSDTLTLPHISEDQLGTYTCTIASLVTSGPAEINITSASKEIEPIAILGSLTANICGPSNLAGSLSNRWWRSSWPLFGK